MVDADQGTGGNIADITTAITKAQAAVAAAIFQLSLDQVTNDIDPTPANAAAVKALSERVATDEATLAALYAELATLQPTTPTTPTPPTIGGGGIPGINEAPPPLPPGLKNAAPIIVTGVVEGAGAAAAAGAWGTFIDESTDWVGHLVRPRRDTRARALPKAVASRLPRSVVASSRPLPTCPRSP